MKAREHLSVRILLLNDKQEVLLMRAEDPKTTEADGTYNGAFWFLLGGEIEGSESTIETALRELYEEAGLRPNEVTLGPEVWYGDFFLRLSGELRHMKQRYVVAYTKRTQLQPAQLTESEAAVIKGLEWFSLARLRARQELVYPIGLDEFIEPILKRQYPTEPQKIDLSRKPYEK